MHRYRPVLFLFTLLLAPVADADTIQVPLDQPTIQAAVITAADGDTVLVSAGTYVENIDLLGKAITLTSVDGPESTTIDGDMAGPVLTISAAPIGLAPGDGDTVVIEGFTITGGQAENGGGISVTSAAALITGNVISGNTAGYAGGAIHVSRSTVTVTGNVITANSAARRGGGIYSTSSNLVVTGNEVRDNFTEDPYTSAGGGVYFDNHSTGEITGNTVTGNTAVGGGGVAIRQQSTALVADNLIDGNHGIRHGGGIAIKIDSIAVIVGNTITNNLSDRMGGGVYIRMMDNLVLLDNEITNNASALGGGVWINQSQPELRNNRIADNEAFTAGGGVMANENSAPLFFSGSISGNFAPRGGALLVTQNSTVTLDGVALTGNLATETGDGAGVAVTDPGAGAQMVNCLLADNAAEGNGGAVSVSAGTVSILNCTVTGNSAGGTGGGLDVAGEGTANVINSILWANGSDITGDGIAVSYTLAEDGLLPGPGNVSADPLFLDQGSGEFGLTAASPAIDSALDDVAPATDREGDPRPTDGDGDLTAITDMGFDEFLDPAPQRLHVSATTMSWVYDEGHLLYNVLAHVTVTDASGLPVQDALVTVEMSYPNGRVKVRTGRTGVNGQATLVVRSRRTGLFRTLVTAVSLTGWVHDRYADETAGNGTFVH